MILAFAAQVRVVAFCWGCWIAGATNSCISWRTLWPIASRNSSRDVGTAAAVVSWVVALVEAADLRLLARVRGALDVAGTWEVARRLFGDTGETSHPRSQRDCPMAACSVLTPSLATTWLLHATLRPHGTRHHWRGRGPPDVKHDAQKSHSYW